MNIINSIAQTLSRSACSSRLIVSLALLATASILHAAPYSGTPIDIPGTLEAEYYDDDGAGIAYYDTSPGNNGPSTIRGDDVDIEACDDTGGGYNVGWTVAGEWLKYSVNVVSNGNYTITSRVASEATTGAFHIEVDDVDVTGSILVGSTGGWQSWQPRTSVVALTAGLHVVKLVAEGNDFNINRFDFTLNGPAPAAPTGLQVDSVGVNTVSLSWTASATGSPTSYTVKRATSSGGTYTTVGSTTAPTVTFTDSVTGGATYYYVVSAVNANGEGDVSSPPVSATPTLGLPDAPTALAATPGNNQVALTWTAPAVGSPSSYNVKRSTTSGSGYSAITTPGAQTTTSYTDTTAVNDTTYYYVVSAVNGNGEGADSTQVIATPAEFATVYEPFDYPVDDNLVNGAAATGAGFNGSWNNGVAGWILSGLTYPGLPVANNAMRTPTGRQSVGLENPISSGTKWISYLWNHSPGDPGGNKNGVYFLNGGEGLYFGWGLGAFDGTQGYMALGSINTLGTAADTTVGLLTKTGAKYTYSGTYLIVLKIDFDTSGNNDTVTVYVNPTANQADPGVSAAAVHTGFDVGTISGIGMQVAGGGDFITDEVRIALTYSAVVDAVTVPPSIPGGLTATPGANQVSLSWNATTGYPTSYNVKRATASGGPYVTIGSTTGSTLSYNDSILGGTTYYYVVSAVNSVGEGGDSSSVSALPILTAPETPASLSVTVGDAQVSLSWPASTFATSYDVKRASHINGPYISIDTTAALTYDDFGVNNAVTYYYVVTAIGAGGTSSDTTPVSGTPFGPLPLALSIDPGVGITWFASNNVTYQVQRAGEDLGTNTVWNNLDESISGNGTTNTVFDPAAEPGNIYQVISY